VFRATTWYTGTYSWESGYDPGLLEKPERGIPGLFRLLIVDLLPALHVKIEGIQRQVVHGRVEGTEPLGVPQVLEELFAEDFPRDPLQIKDERNCLRWSEILDRPDAHHRVQVRCYIRRHHSLEQSVEKPFEPLRQGEAHGIRELCPLPPHRGARLLVIGFEDRIEPFLYDGGLLLFQDIL
jgi:hypothetical protein